MNKKKIIGTTQRIDFTNDGPNSNKVQNWIDKASQLNQLKLRQFQQGENSVQKNEDNDLFEIRAFSGEEEEEEHEEIKRKQQQTKQRKTKKKQQTKSFENKKLNYEASLNDKFFNNPVVSREMAFDELAFFINMEANIITHLQQTHQKVEELRKVCSKFK